MTTMQKYAWIYAVVFLAIALLGYVPPFQDADGNLFGLFSLQLHDDLLHLASGIWAGVAAWRSEQASLQYFKLFGVIYGLDGVLGLFTGLGYLDLGIVLQSFPNLDLMTRIMTNLPHLLIGGIAVWIGYSQPSQRHSR